MSALPELFCIPILSESRRKIVRVCETLCIPQNGIKTRLAVFYRPLAFSAIKLFENPRYMGQSAPSYARFTLMTPAA